MTSSPKDEPESFAWLDGIDVAATVCDRQGVCLYLNERAAQSFAKDGGRALLGQNLLDCHPEPARSRFAAQLATPTPNSYTIESRENRQALTDGSRRGSSKEPLEGSFQEENGIRRLIHQIPRYKGDVFSGVVELSFPLPETLPHFVRAPG